MQKHDFFIFPDTIRPNNHNARICKFPSVLQPALVRGGAGRRMRQQQQQQLCGRLGRSAATKRIPVEKRAQYRGMDLSRVSCLVKPSSGTFKGRPPKQSHPLEAVQMDSTENDNQGPSCNERTAKKKKGHHRVEVPDLCTIPETVAEKFSYGCPYCEAMFATKVHLQKHKMWNHSERVNMGSKIAVTMEPTSEPKTKPKLQKHPVKENSKKRPMENRPSSPVFLKVKKFQEMSQPSRNGECTDQRTEKKQQHSSQQPQQKGTFSDPGASESEGSSLPPTLPEEDPERMKHRRKQKTPKKFTGEQPSISGTFGLKGMNKLDEKLKVGRTKRSEGTPFIEESQKKQPTLVPAKRELPCRSQAPPLDSEVQDALLEHSEVSCSTCSIVTYKTCPGFKKKICQKAPISEETELDSMKEDEKEQSPADKTKSDPAQMKIMEEKRENKKCARMEAEEELLDLERTPSGRVRRRSAQVAVFHLQEIAEDELAKDWGTKRRIKDDLVPDIKRLNYTRPGLPTYNPETLDTWKNEVKEKGFICCPNSSCEAIYSSVSGLKAHLTSCIKGGVNVGKYTCLLCQKEFSSESGVKYHICKTHSQNWFRATGHMSNSKKKDSQSKELQKDMKNGVPWKKRGRKPKERLVETTPTQEKTLNNSNGPSMNHQTASPSIRPTPIQTSSQNPACTTPDNIPTPMDGTTLTHNRDLKPPVKKRAKPNKAPLTE
ncbi:zinc finger protein 512B isoform X2 [Neoarius graeffei]|uniref:zinc finger protein 512B isoform X2 n=1 Tax=Neoarius graeffei TaxID=443677 RepID=UPI00298BFEA7|nr:zinc finger protein 512B isoform X2 [Neoarius graeffei]